MMSVFQLIAQHQFLFLCSILPTCRFDCVHVCVNESQSAVCLPYYYIKDNYGLVQQTVQQS